MKKITNPLLLLAAATHGGEHFMAEGHPSADCCGIVDGAELAPPDLVKKAAKIFLRRTLSHHGWNAQLNSKANLRRAAMSGRFRDMPPWVQAKIRHLHFRLSNTHRPVGLL